MSQSYETEKDMPLFYQQLKATLNWPAAWGNSPTTNFDEWRAEARNILFDCINPAPPSNGFNPEVVATEQRNGYQARKILFNVSDWSRIPAYLLVPDGEGPFPAIIMLHDHGAHFSIGKEKVVRPFGVSSEVMADATNWAEKCYDHQFAGDYFAANGFVVLAIDALFWGERGRKEGTRYDSQQALASNFMQMGMSWGGVITHDDIRSAEFLATLPEVDDTQIGAAGFSMGAHRAWMLAAATDKVKAAASICWMNTTEHLMTLTNNQNKGGSAYSMLVPGIRNYLDYPHVASIACPKPMLFFNGTQDKLFPVEGVEEAYTIMQQVWSSQGKADNLVTKLWKLPHTFNKEMQAETLDWFKQHLTHIQLNAKTFLVHPDARKMNNKYIFPTFQEAVEHITDGTEAEPMTIYLAPSVYWIDNPDDPVIRIAADGSAPIGMTIKCEWLKLKGLCTDPRDVVLAANRGQTQGAKGNYTMFHFIGNGLSIENLTIGNYCNIDLEYPLNPQLNRKKRAEAIVQAQLAFCDGDKITAENVRFVSRLNLAPLWGGKRILFRNCHFECTDDALTSNAVYLDCHFTLYSSKPFYSAPGTGAVILNSTIDVVTRGRQNFTKNGGTLALVNTRFRSASDSIPYIGWMDNPPADTRGYQYNLLMNEKPLTIESEHPELTIDMAGKGILDAYLVNAGSSTPIYNIYNLLSGDDGWNPMQMPECPNKLPTYLKITSGNTFIESGKDTLTLVASAWRFGNYPGECRSITWSVAKGCEKYVQLHPAGTSCKVTGTNTGDYPQEITIIARTPEGLEAATVLTVAPQMVDAPAFSALPALVVSNEEVEVIYRLDSDEREDRSRITWYRCTGKDGSGAIAVSCNHQDTPNRIYKLTPGDAGYYLMATVEPKHIRSHTGKAGRAITDNPIAFEVNKDTHLYTDFSSFPTQYQPEIIPGFWTVDAYKPADTAEYEWTPNPANSWMYGTAPDAARGRLGLVQASRGARLLYTPVKGEYTDMEVALTVSPCKSAGQGFGSATGQYMDICIKFNTQTKTGYALRIVRTPKHSRAVDFVLVEYNNGAVSYISKAVTSDCFHAPCHIQLAVRENRLMATIAGKVNIEAPITPTVHGGFGILHTGSIGSNAILLDNLNIRWGKLTIFTIGDSTMANKKLDGGNTERGWGHVLPGFFAEEVRIDNHAVNGRSTKSFIDEGRWDAVINQVNPGDYVFIQFGHNDQKDDEARHTDPGSTFDANLERFVTETRQKGGKPVIFTSIVRRHFDEATGKLIDSHGEYITATRNVAARMNVPLIDLNTLTHQWVEALGDEASKQYFMWIKKDNTHLNIAGAKAVAAMVVQTFKDKLPELVPYVRNYDFVVAQDGSGDFFTVQEAIDHVPNYRKQGRTRILIRQGIYKEKLIVPESKINISLIGQGQVVLTYDDYSQKKNIFGEELSTSGSASCYIYADGFQAENITFQNTAGPVGQAVAAFVAGDEAVFRNCRFLGFQDTLYTYGKNSRQYYEDCYIEGTVDFIFGWSTAVFNRCTIHSKGNGYITAPATPQGHKYGYVFIDCNITADEGVEKVYLSRPWRPYAQAVFIRCHLGKHILPEGWHNWNKKYAEATIFYAEFESTGPGANPGKRASFSSQLESAEGYEITEILNHLDVPKEN